MSGKRDWGEGGRTSAGFQYILLFLEGQNESSTCPFPSRPFDMQLLAQSRHLDSLPVPVKKWSITPHQGTRYQPQFSLFPDPHQGRPRTSTFFLPLFQLSSLKCRGKAGRARWLNSSLHHHPLHRNTKFNDHLYKKAPSYEPKSGE